MKRQNRRNEEAENTIVQDEDFESNNELRTLEANVDTSFFYTNDKFINSFDNDEIIAKICTRYKELNGKNSDAVIKKNIVHFLDDEKFVEYILQYYSMTILELFKVIYCAYGSIFKGPYLKKIRKIVSSKKYAKFDKREKH